jgi:hypothetical protein
VLPWAKRISVFTKKSLKQQANTYMVHCQHTKGGKTFSAAHGETGEATINCSRNSPLLQTENLERRMRACVRARERQKFLIRCGIEEAGGERNCVRPGVVIVAIAEDEVDAVALCSFSWNRRNCC